MWNTVTAEDSNDRTVALKERQGHLGISTSYEIKKKKNTRKD